MAASRVWTKACAAAGAMAVAAVAALATASPAQAATPWTLATSPNPGSVENFLNAVACADATHCWAVGGTAGSGGFTQALIERWNGTAWTVDTAPDENGSSTQYNVLRGVTCISATDCWAVGFFFDSASSHYFPLWEYWDGTSWTASTFAVGIASDYRLNAVSCVDDNHCWAVGSKVTGTSTTVWFQQWNGSVWTTNPSTDLGEMNGVSCVDATHCWAVGDDRANPDHTVIETWNGTAWTLTSSPNSGTNSNDLEGVSCVSTTWCWAVGSVSGGTFDQNLFEHWDGSTWTIPADTTASDNNSPSAHDNFLAGVTCKSTTFCWAVGATQANGTLDVTLIDGWDGTSWTLVPNTPNGGTTRQGSLLLGVSCAGTTFCAAAGEYFFPDPTLILQYQVAAPTPTPTPSAIPVPPTGAAPAATASPLGLPLVAGGALLVLVISAVSVAGRRRLRGD